MLSRVGESMGGKCGFELGDAGLEHVAFHLVLGLGFGGELLFHKGELGAAFLEGEQALVFYFVGQFVLHGSTPCRCVLP